MSQQQGERAPYVITPTDVLWLHRAVEHEGPVREQVAAVLLNGFAWARAGTDGTPYRGTLTDWIRSYAQPVNPLWFVGGRLHDAKVTRLQTAMAVASPEERGRLERELLDEQSDAAARRIYSVQQVFSAGTQAAVRAALAGKVAIPPEATDYAIWSHDASYKGYVPLTRKKPGTNRLWRRPGAEGWAGYASPTGSSFVVGALLLLAGGAAVAKKLGLL